MIELIGWFMAACGLAMAALISILIKRNNDGHR
jgi:hypothetical protein